MESLRFPIGRFTARQNPDQKFLESRVAILKSFPDRLAVLANSFSEKELDTPYRPGGWTGRQVIHHLADSHMNCNIRFRWVLTENKPRIKAYDERAWALLSDAKSLPVKSSLLILRGVHERLCTLIASFSKEDWDKYFIHPEGDIRYTLSDMVQLYAWHGDHHLAHLQLIKGDKVSDSES